MEGKKDALLPLVYASTETNNQSKHTKTGRKMRKKLTYSTLFLFFFFWMSFLRIEFRFLLLTALFQPVHLTVSLPAVPSYREGSDSIAGDPRGGGGDLHLDAPCALLVVALQSCSVQR